LQIIGYVKEHLAEPGGGLVVDETGFLKKGIHSAGVQWQYIVISKNSHSI